MVLLGDLLGAQVLLHGEREVRAALHRRVVGDDHALAALDDADPGHDPGRRRRVVVDVPRGERGELEERAAGVDEPVDALARRAACRASGGAPATARRRRARRARCAREARRRARSIRSRRRAKSADAAVGLGGQQRHGHDPTGRGGREWRSSKFPHFADDAGNGWGRRSGARRSRLALGGKRVARAVRGRMARPGFPQYPQGGVSFVAGPEPPFERAAERRAVAGPPASRRVRLARAPDPVRAVPRGREDHGRPAQEPAGRPVAAAPSAGVVTDRRVDAVSPFAAAVGYSRAVRVGDRVFVSGTAPIMPDGAEPPADAYGQARRCLEIIVDALARARRGARRRRADPDLPAAAGGHRRRRAAPTARCSAPPGPPRPRSWSSGCSIPAGSWRSRPKPSSA